MLQTGVREKAKNGRKWLRQLGIQDTFNNLDNATLNV